MPRHYYGHATAAVFAPLEPLSRPSQVARRLSDAITLGLLADGAQLPGEADLAATLGVSTVTVREALAVLRSDQLLETRRGRGGGSFVRLPPGGVAGLARRRLRQLSVVELRDLSDLYATVSGGAAAYAARRGTADDHAQIRTAASDFAAATEPGERRRADARLRVLVAVTAQSPRLYRAEVDLQAEIGTLLWLTLDDDAVHGTEAAHTRRLVSQIARRHPDAARSVAEERVRGASARLIDLRITDEPPAEES